MDEEQQYDRYDGPAGSEAPAAATDSAGSQQPAANAAGSQHQQAAFAPRFVYQNQPNVVNPMGVANAMNQPASNAPQYVYQNQPAPMGVVMMSQQPANAAPQYEYQKPTVGNSMGVAVNQQQQQQPGNAPQYAYQNQPNNYVSPMGVVVNQRPANGPQIVYQTQPNAVNQMGVAVSQQPANNSPQIVYQNQQVVLNGQFSTGLFECFNDTSLFCLTLWCPCITFGRIAEIVDRGSTSCGTAGVIYSLVLCCTWLQFIYSCTYRQKMRAQLGMQEDCFGDFCIHFWCECCALTQEYRELQLRGYDLALGWHGNVARQSQAVVLPPPVPSGMIR